MFKRLALLVVLTTCIVSAHPLKSQSTTSCRMRSDLAGKCFTVHGRLSVYNGTPSIRLWPLGTKRLLGVFDPQNPSSEPGQSTIPASVLSKLNFDKDVFGDFLVCPLTRSRPGRMQTICIESGNKFSVRPHK